MVLLLLLLPCLLALPLDLDRSQSWLHELDLNNIDHKNIKKIVIPHDADGDQDGTYEEFEININNPTMSEANIFAGSTTEGTTAAFMNSKESNKGQEEAEAKQKEYQAKEEVLEAQEESEKAMKEAAKMLAENVSNKAEVLKAKQEAEALKEDAFKAGEVPLKANLTVEMARKLAEEEASALKAMQEENQAKDAALNATLNAKAKTGVAKQGAYNESTPSQGAEENKNEKKLGEDNEMNVDDEAAIQPDTTQEANRKSAGEAAKAKVLRHEPRALSTVTKVLQRMASFFLMMFQQLTTTPQDQRKPNPEGKRESSMSSHGERPQAGGNDYSMMDLRSQKPEDNEKGEKESGKGEDKDILSYLYD
jgi:hypothetical protein